MKLTSIGGFALAVSFVALVSGSAPEMARAQTITCIEGVNCGTTVQGGSVINLTEAGGASLFIASDGEILFDPFGYGADTSDGIILNAAAGQTWTPDNTNGAFNAGYWTQIDGSWGGAFYPNTWVLPASIPGCGGENEPTCEPIAVWDYSAPLPPLTLILQEPDGSYSDGIFIRNVGPNGNAVLIFASDPAIVVPEPSTWAMMALGFAALGYLGYCSRKRPAGLAA